MEWTDSFSERLRDIERPIAPMFRLQIGSPCVAGNHMSTEEARSAKVLELLTHPGSAKYNGENLYEGRGIWSEDGLSYPYAYLVGLTDKISVGAQSVVPRTFQYTGSNLSVDVTRKAFSAAITMFVGCLARLQINLSAEEDKSPDAWEGNWQDIWIGQYTGAKWNGQKYSLSFVSALQAVKQRHTQAERISSDSDYEEAEQVADEERFKWFAGLGRNPMVFTSTGLTAPIGTFRTMRFSDSVKHVNKNCTGDTYKKREPFAYDSTAFALRDSIDASDYDPPRHGQWLACTNGLSKATWVFYQKQADNYIYQANSSGSAGGISANVALPGRDNMSAVDWDGVTGSGTGLAAGASAKTVCVVSGDPVKEVVNLIYVQGYAPEMVPGLFAKGMNSLVSRTPLNREDIEVMIGYFDRIYGFTANDNPPLRHVVTASQSDGLSYVSKFLGKWGVFPRWKAGGWSVGVAAGTGFVVPSAYASEGNRPGLVLPKDIEGAEYDLVDPQTRGSFNRVMFQNKDPDANPYDGTSDEAAYITKAADEALFNSTRASSGTPLNGTPQMGTLINSTTDAAAGSTEGYGIGARWAYNYAEFFGRELFPHFWATRRATCTLRLRGLKFANLAPGDRVHICIPSGGSKKVYGWGPWVSTDGGMEETGGIENHVLSSIPWDGTERGAEVLENWDDGLSYYTPWFVMSHQVDWIGNKVTMILSRPIPRGAQTPIDFHMSVPGGFDHDQALTGIADIEITDD